MSAFRPCILVPTYDNPRTIGKVVAALRELHPDIVVVDDGSGPEGHAAVEALRETGEAQVVHRPHNGGKGAAVKTGLFKARELGFTHVLQVDADGQHNLEDIPRFLETARERPEALILGQPQFDETAPAGRRIGRQISVFWVNVETGGRVIGDPLCGFRVYPVAPAIRACARGQRMDFDPEIAVRMVWLGVPVVNLPTRVRYLSEEEGGVSHFKMFQDNLLISMMHTRLVITRILHWVTAPLRRALPSGAEPT